LCAGSLAVQFTSIKASGFNRKATRDFVHVVAFSFQIGILLERPDVFFEYVFFIHRNILGTVLSFNRVRPTSSTRFL
jgi:hypothetical protein